MVEGADDERGLIRKAESFSESISGYSTNNGNILIAAHHDADGICGSALLSEFIFKEKGHCQVRTTSEPSVRFLEKLASSNFDFVIFVDICAGLTNEVSRLFGDKWLIIDHHGIPESEINNEKVLNPWQFGFDGTKDVSSSGLCYYVSEKARKPQFAFLALVGSLSDRQDVGPRRSLVGLNAKIYEKDVQTFRAIGSSIDLLFLGRESRPAHESIANGLTCFIPGLTGNKDACLASLRSAGIELKVSNRWKTIADFSEEEKQRVLEATVPHLAGTTNTVEDLVGSVYLLNSADEYSVMRDARDFALLLNACGRMGRSGLGLSLCMGGASSFSNGVEQVSNDYRLELIRSVQTLLSSEDRFREKGEYVVIVGDGIVSERMTGAVCQMLASFSRLKSKVVFLRTTTHDGDVKVSTRMGKDMARIAGDKFDLGVMMTKVAKATSGVGGGHQNAAGARFSIVKQQEFQFAVDETFQTLKLS